MTKSPKSLATLIAAIDRLDHALKQPVWPPLATDDGEVARPQPQEIRGFGHPGHCGHPKPIDMGFDGHDELSSSAEQRQGAEAAPEYTSFRGGQSGQCGQSPCFSKENSWPPTPLRWPKGGQSRGFPGVEPYEDDPAEVLTRERFLAFDCGALEVEAIEGVPREWCEGAALLAAMPPPRAFDASRWAEIVADVRRFLREWGAEACRLRWSEWALFGICRPAPASWRGAELLVLLRGRSVVSLTARAATIKVGPTNTLTYCLRPRDPLHPAERALLWEIQA